MRLTIDIECSPETERQAVLIRSMTEGYVGQIAQVMRSSGVNPHVNFQTEGCPKRGVPT